MNLFNAISSALIHIIETLQEYTKENTEEEHQIYLTICDSQITNGMCQKTFKVCLPIWDLYIFFLGLNGGNFSVKV
jgi:hypothetical protein